jgi:acetyltransferase-like isoleucine patch superfamily enzyme
MKNFHSTAVISNEAEIGANCKIGPFSVIHPNVKIGDGVQIGSFCELGVPTDLGDGSPLVISDNSLIRSHSIFYESSIFGPNLVTGHHVTVRENTSAGKGFQIGTLSEIQGDCLVGDYVRFQSNIFVGKKTTIGNFVWLFPYVILTNDPTPPSNILLGCIIEDFASIAAGSVILPGVTIGKRSVIGAQSCVTKDIPSGHFAYGSPARDMGDASAIKLKGDEEGNAYPWTLHFSRGYPAEIVKDWNSDLDKC